MLQRAPVVHKDGREWNALGIPQPDGVDSQGYMNTFFKDYEVRIGGHTARVEVPERVYVYAKVDGEPITAARVIPRSAVNDNVLEEYRFLVGLGGGDVPCVGFHQRRGLGSVTVLGTPASPELIVILHAFLGVPIPARPLTPGVHAILSRKGDERYLIVLNTGWEDKSATIVLDPSALPGITVRRPRRPGRPGRAGRRVPRRRVRALRHPQQAQRHLGGVASDLTTGRSPLRQGR